MENIRVKIKKVHEDAKIPEYKSEGAAAFDIYSIEDVLIESGKVAHVKTGLKFEFPKGYGMCFWDRGGLGAKGIHHFGGLTDSDYRGEPIVILYNSTDETYKIEKGDRIIQAVILKIPQVKFEEVAELSETERGEGRFHSTGKK